MDCTDGSEIVWIVLHSNKHCIVLKSMNGSTNLKMNAPPCVEANMFQPSAQSPQSNAFLQSWEEWPESIGSF